MRKRLVGTLSGTQPDGLITICFLGPVEVGMAYV
jgi:hypothetical protein